MKRVCFLIAAIVVAALPAHGATRSVWIDDLTWPEVRDAIAATKDYMGITGKTTIDAHRDAAKSAVIITVKDGKFKFVESVNP